MFVHSPLPPPLSPPPCLCAGRREAAQLAAELAPHMAAQDATLRALGLCLHLTLSETFFRPHQVLPARTHPAMVFHGASGYLLRGTVTAHPYSVVDGGAVDVAAAAIPEAAAT